MSGYAMAITGAADLMTGASADAAYEAAFGTYYRAAASMRNSANAKVAAEANIAAIKQDRINTDKVIAMNQDEAEAQAKVMAAVAGTEGQSVDSTIQQTKINSSLAKANTRAQAGQMIEQQLAQVYSSQSALLAADNPQVEKISVGMSVAESLMGVMGSMGGEVMDGIDGLFTSEPDVGSAMAVNYQPTDFSDDALYFGGGSGVSLVT